MHAILHRLPFQCSQQFGGLHDGPGYASHISMVISISFVACVLNLRDVHSCQHSTTLQLAQWGPV